MRTIIYGPPGTGKTTRLLKEIDKKMQCNALLCPPAASPNIYVET